MRVTSGGDGIPASAGGSAPLSWQTCVWVDGRVAKLQIWVSPGRCTEFGIFFFFGDGVGGTVFLVTAGMSPVMDATLRLSQMFRFWIGLSVRTQKKKKEKRKQFWSISGFSLIHFPELSQVTSSSVQTAPWSTQATLLFPESSSCSWTCVRLMKHYRSRSFRCWKHPARGGPPPFSRLIDAVSLTTYVASWRRLHNQSRQRIVDAGMKFTPIFGCKPNEHGPATRGGDFCGLSLLVV